MEGNEDMSKTIRVEQDTYDELERLRDWKATFDQVIKRLLELRLLLEKATPIIEGQREFYKQKVEHAGSKETDKP
jgi:predicted CopG family antitoxin